LMFILNDFLLSETDFTSPLAEKREVKGVAIVALSSNSSLCGAFNSNVIHLFRSVWDEYSSLPTDNRLVYPIGKKMEDFCKKSEIPIQGSWIELMDKPNFNGAKELADQLIADFLAKKIDRVELVYNHFKNTVIQVPTKEQFLPVVFDLERDPSPTKNEIDYILEPDRATIMASLIPKALCSKIYAILLDSATAEQAARTMAMQIASDNADDILNELTIQFNKQRQQAITSELLDIIGGAEALK